MVFTLNKTFRFQIHRDKKHCRIPSSALFIHRFHTTRSGGGGARRGRAARGVPQPLALRRRLLRGLEPLFLPHSLRFDIFVTC